MYVVSEDNYLEHYGRKGMKWGQHIFGKVKNAKRRVGRTVKNLNTTYYNFQLRESDAEKRVIDAFMARQFKKGISMEFKESYKITKLWISDFVNSFKDVDIEYFLDSQKIHPL